MSLHNKKFKPLAKRLKASSCRDATSELNIFRGTKAEKFGNTCSKRTNTLSVSYCYLINSRPMKIDQ